MSSRSGLMEFLLDNIFVLIILVNIIFRVFQKKPQEEIPASSPDIDWFDPDNQDFDEWVDGDEAAFDVAYQDQRGSVVTHTSGGIPS